MSTADEDVLIDAFDDLDFSAVDSMETVKAPPVDPAKLEAEARKAKNRDRKREIKKAIKREKREQVKNDALIKVREFFGLTET